MKGCCFSFELTLMSIVRGGRDVGGEPRSMLCCKYLRYI